MNRFICLGLLLALQSALLAAEPTVSDSANRESSASTGAAAIQNGSTDAEQQTLHDPFAEEEEHGHKALKISDPLERMNRAFFTFNDRLYFWVLKPVATGYSKVAPEPFRQSIGRFFVNLRYPVRLVNNVFQGKFKGAGIETARFVVNSTVGIAGLFDPAREEWNLRPYTEDLDQTLGYYGLPTGIYLNWPLFGPSSVRGTVGTVGDSFLSVWNYIDGAAVFYSTRVYDTVNSSSLQLGQYESLKQSTLDPYAALRDAYFEHRRHLIEE